MPVCMTDRSALTRSSGQVETQRADAPVVAGSGHASCGCGTTRLGHGIGHPPVRSTPMHGGSSFFQGDVMMFTSRQESLPAKLLNTEKVKSSPAPHLFHLPVDRGKQRHPLVHSPIFTRNTSSPSLSSSQLSSTLRSLLALLLVWVCSLF